MAKQRREAATQLIQQKNICERGFLNDSFGLISGLAPVGLAFVSQTRSGWDGIVYGEVTLAL